MSAPSVSSSAPSALSLRLYDAAVIGGGPGGLSAALGLARASRRVLVLDQNSYRNERVAHMHNVLGHDGDSPAAFREAGAKQILERYPTVERRMQTRAERVLLRQDATQEEQRTFPPTANVRIQIASSSDSEGTKAASISAAGPAASGSGSGSASGSASDGEEAEFVFSRKLVLATGMKDLPVEPSIPGWQELWGTVIQFCPYCDGHEQRHGPWAVLLRSNASERLATPELHLPAFPTQMFAHYLAVLFTFNKKITLFTHGQKVADLLSSEQLAAIQAKGIQVQEGVIAQVRPAPLLGDSCDGGLEVLMQPSAGASASASSPLRFRSLYCRPSYVQAALVRDLGLKQHPAFATLEVDMFGKTSKAHVVACGDAARTDTDTDTDTHAGRARAARGRARRGWAETLRSGGSCR